MIQAQAQALLPRTKHQKRDSAITITHRSFRSPTPPGLHEQPLHSAEQHTTAKPISCVHTHPSPRPHSRSSWGAVAIALSPTNGDAIELNQWPRKGRAGGSGMATSPALSLAEAIKQIKRLQPVKIGRVRTRPGAPVREKQPVPSRFHVVGERRHPTDAVQSVAGRSPHRARKAHARNGATSSDIGRPGPGVHRSSRASRALLVLACDGFAGKRGGQRRRLHLHTTEESPAERPVTPVVNVVHRADTTAGGVGTNGAAIPSRIFATVTATTTATAKLTATASATAARFRGPRKRRTGDTCDVLAPDD